MNDEDLKFVLSITTESSQVNKALEEMGKTIDDTAAKASEQISGAFDISPGLARPIPSGKNIANIPTAPYVAEPVGGSQVDPAVAAVNKALAEMKANLDRQSKNIAADNQGREGFVRGLFRAGRDSTSLLLSALLGAVQGRTPGATGATLGQAIAGPAGAVAGGAIGGAVGAAPAALGAAANIPTQAVSYGLNQIGAALRAIQGPLGPISVGFNALSQGLGIMAGAVRSLPLIGSVAGPLATTLAGIPNLLQEITSTFVDMAGKASPGVFRTWQIALEDVQGVIGRAFVPVLEIMRDGVRLFGDVLANILPNMSEARGALSEFRAAFGEFGATVRNLLTEIGPSIRETFIAGLQELSHWLAVATRAIAIMALRLRESFGGATGGPPRVETGPRTSVGAAARSASIGGVEDYQRRLYESAFAQPGTSVQDQTLGVMTQMLDADQEALSMVQSIDAGIESFKGVFNTSVSIASQTLEVMKSILSGINTLVGVYKAAQAALTPSDATANKIASVMNYGEETRGLKLDKGREQMKKLHPEYFTGGR